MVMPGHEIKGKMFHKMAKHSGKKAINGKVVRLIITPNFINKTVSSLLNYLKFEPSVLTERAFSGEFESFCFFSISPSDQNQTNPLQEVLKPKRCEKK